MHRVINAVWIAGSYQVHDDESLVQRAKQYDEEAFAELYEKYFDKIYRYVALKVGDRMEAEDITQQVFLKAIKSISSFKWKGFPFSSWLFRIAHNQVVDYLRKRKKQGPPILHKTDSSFVSLPTETRKRTTVIRIVKILEI